MTDDNKASEPSEHIRVDVGGNNSAVNTGVGGQATGLFALLGSGAGLAAAAKYGADVAKTALTERGKTRREQLNQDGQTERARIAAGSNSPAPAEPDGEGPPDGAPAAPGGAA
ncbi:hypothetical protein [Streptomyces aureus]|uniref:hypothetical protein n=1 Tax=Streptomyces aureus TaxID=193461 RepID=UPI00369C7B81